MAVFTLGQLFYSFEDLEKAIAIHEEKTFSKFWKREARLITSARRVQPVRPELKYVEIKFCCIFGGQKFRSTGKGIRTVRTFKKEEPCTAHVALRATHNGRALEVKHISDEHNHETSQSLFHYLPRRRKLSRTDKEAAQELLAMEANKKLAMENLEEQTENNLTLKDLSNIAASNSRRKSEDLQHCFNQLIAKYKSNVSIFTDEENNFRGIFIQTTQMKNTIQAFPEFICVDGTHKLINIGIPLFLILAEDSNFQSEIVALCLLTTEDKTSFKWFLETFKNNNPKWKHTKCIMTDKELLEKSIIKDCFPDVTIITCIFRVMKTFSREITSQRFGISNDERNEILRILQEMVECKTDYEFECLHTTLKERAPIGMLEYFDTNWYPIKDEWTLSKKYMVGSFGNTTRNRVESLNQKLKQVITKNSKLEEFVNCLFDALSSLEHQRDFKAIYLLQKRLVRTYPPESDEKQILDCLTYEAAKRVIQQLEYAKNVKINGSGSSYIIQSTRGTLHTGSDYCDCSFHKSMLLPCKHIFAIRAHLGRPIFSKDMIKERWTMSYYEHSRKCLVQTCSTEVDTNALCNQRTENDDFTESHDLVSSGIIKPRTYAEKRREALHTTDSLANLAGLVSNDLYDERIGNLKTLEFLWKQGKRARIIMIDDDEELWSHDTLCAALNVAPANYEYLISQRKDSEKEEPEVQPQSPVSDLPSCPKLRITSNVILNSSVNKAFTIQELPLGFHDENGSPRSETSTNKQRFQETQEYHPVDNIEQYHLNIHETSPTGIQIPLSIRKRDPPKETDLTATDIAKRKKGTCVPFDKLQLQIKQKTLLSCFVDETVVDDAMNGILIQGSAVKTDLDRIPNSISNESLDMSIIRCFFTEDAWKTTENVIEMKRSARWLCKVCNFIIKKECKNIMCAMCLELIHAKCANLSSKQEDSWWFCSECENMNLDTNVYANAL